MERHGGSYWAGILGAAFALLGAVGSGGTLFLPHLLPPEALGRLLDAPRWFKPLTEASDLAAFVLSLFFLYASVRLVKKGGEGVTLFLWALGVSTAFQLLKGATAVASLSVLGLVYMAGSLFWIIVNLGLFLLVRWKGSDPRA